MALKHISIQQLFCGKMLVDEVEPGVYMIIVGGGSGTTPPDPPAATPAFDGSPCPPTVIDIGDAIAAMDFSANFSHADGLPLSYTLSPSVPGLVIDPSTGVLSGTPTVDGVFTIVIAASDANGAVATNGAGCEITINGNTAPVDADGQGDVDATIDVATNIDVTQGWSDAEGDTITYSISGTLPDGLTFSNGVISGTPTTLGVSTITLSADDGNGGVTTETFDIEVVLPAPPAFDATTPCPAMSWVECIAAAPVDLSAGFSGTNLTYAASGLPAGMSMSATGSLTGTPTAPFGPFTIVVTATDNAGRTITNGAGCPATVSENQPPVIHASTAAGIDVAHVEGDVVSYDFSAIDPEGQTVTYAMFAGFIPDGLTFDTATGILSGTLSSTSGGPTQFGSAGQTSFAAFSATDECGKAARATARFTVADEPPVADASNCNRKLSIGVSDSFDYMTMFSDPGNGPMTASATGVPDGMTFSAAGVLSGTPTTLTNYTLIITVEDDSGVATGDPNQSVSKKCAISVINQTPVLLAPLPGRTSRDGDNVSANFSGQFSDPDGPAHTLTYSATGLPPSLIIDPTTGIVSGEISSGTLAVLFNALGETVTGNYSSSTFPSPQQTVQVPEGTTDFYMGLPSATGPGGSYVGILRDPNGNIVSQTAPQSISSSFPFEGLGGLPEGAYTFEIDSASASTYSLPIVSDSAYPQGTFGTENADLHMQVLVIVPPASARSPYPFTITATDPYGESVTGNASWRVNS